MGGYEEKEEKKGKEMRGLKRVKEYET